MKNKVEFRENMQKSMFGEVELIYKNPKTGEVVYTHKERNLIKIFAKETITHAVPFSKVWDPSAGSGSGGWVDTGIDPLEDFKIKYILLGASFDNNGIPLESNDPRYYQLDPVTGLYKPIKLEPGAAYDGELINAIPLADPTRPLKKIESVTFNSTYQPASTPLLQDDVRAINNVLVLETTLKSDEYNGFGLTHSDYFTITEVALVAGKTIDALPDCEIKPRDLFLDGPYGAVASGGDVVTLNDVGDIDKIKAGDQIKITEPTVTAGGSDFGQVNPYYLVLEKAGSGRDLVLDRTPVGSDGIPIAGDINIYRDTLRIFAHRILSSPAKKNEDFEIIIRWSIFVS